MTDMDKCTLTALKGSIRKWERIANGKGIDHGSDNCPLCKLFIMDACCGCPVRRRSGYGFCRNTPYDEWRDADVNRAVTAEYRALAQAELDFLRSLLPEGET